MHLAILNQSNAGGKNYIELYSVAKLKLMFSKECQETAVLCTLKLINQNSLPLMRDSYKLIKVHSLFEF